jgi:hypothetical protein
MALSAVTASTAVKLSNSRVKVDSSNGLGRGLTATQPISAGSLLLRLDPLVSVLDNEILPQACSTCFSVSKTIDNTAGKELLKCTGCGMLRYCSKVCPSSYNLV